MMEFSSLVWAIPILLFISVIISFTVNHSEQTVKLNISVAMISFLLSLSVIIERYINNDFDYGYYIDWFVLDNFYYRIGYELNHTSAYFLVVVTGLNLIILLMNRQYRLQSNNATYGYINLLCGLLTCIIMADNVLTYYIISFCTSVALYLKLASLNVVGIIHVLRRLSKTLIIGHLLFLCALMLIFYHQPSHAVEFTIIDSSLSIQPDLLDTENEWIIGLLLVLSTIFISAVLVPFEHQLRENPLNHVVTVYVLTSLRIFMPAYMLIRFESLIRIDTLTESMVVLLGAVLLLYTCYKMMKQTMLTDILLNMSNAMLGMLYLMFGLQAKLMLSALVLVYLFVYLLIFMLILFSQQRFIYNTLKTLMCLVLLLPFVLCISASNHYSLNITSHISTINVVAWIGIATYSLIIFIGLSGFKNSDYKNNVVVYNKSVLVFCFILIVAISLLVPVSMSWWNEFKAEERFEFTIALSNQMWVNIIILCIFILIGLLGSILWNMVLIRYKPKFKTSLNYIVVKPLSKVKSSIVFITDRVEQAWDYSWEKAIPFVFKKGDTYFSTKQPKIISKIVIVWVVAVIVAILLVMIRG